MNAMEMKAALFAAEDIKIEPVETPEWAPRLPRVWVRTLSADQISQLSCLEDSAQEFRVGAAMAMVTEDGVSLGFNEAELALFGEKHGGVIKRVYDAAMIATGLKEDPAKNSRATTGAAGGSSSASTSESLPGSSASS
jgi:hypothetical protein